ncbi:heterokaryon incompatibility protein-domain-containing protein [Immersiella caudata]|uniref:Heterokaryon incompatibility protein-domain-containing protein n=1 Tax=Immersiella caudata TaxID=314043 RepID=A0AA40BZU6_9PEZI|nr:heterokaryon incompatibility protein-domain-containing protein [Immersiella caudata]
MPKAHKIQLRRRWEGESNRQASHIAANPPAYSPLDLHGRQIRILRLLPATSLNDPIHCALYTAYLHDRPNYEALSYAWGDPAVRQEIFVNGRATKVTVNLVAALRRLRRRRCDRHLWADALCINQADTTEKSHQVNLMKEIYSSTTRALLWLGDFARPRSNPSSAAMTSKDVGLAFDFLKRLAADGCSDLDENLAELTLAIDGLDRLVNLPWWKRIWTVQEAVLPKQAVIVCGTKQLPLSTLLAAGLNSKMNNIVVDDCIYINDFWNVSSPIRYLRNSSGAPGLAAFALSTFRDRKASDPRDNVFALLGLGSSIVADYSLPSEQVFVRCVRTLIADSGGLVPLLRLPEPELNRSPTLPTWVPDFRVHVSLGGRTGDQIS